MTRDPVVRGVRPLATATAAVAITAVVTLLRGPGGVRPVPAVTAGLVVALIGVVRLRTHRAGPVGGTLVVVGTSVAALGVRAWLNPRGADLDLLLAALGAAFTAAGLLRNDRRLVLIGIGQWLVAAVRPLPGSGTFRHCLVATDVTVPLPRLDAGLVLGAALVAIGVGLRVAGRSRDAARGFELGGLATVLTALLLKATQLDGLALLCGNGDALDPGWAVASLAAAFGAIWFGLATRDAAWATAGLLSLVSTSVVGSVLSRSPVWAIAGATPLLVVLVALERRGVVWPHHLGYAAPWPGRPRLPFDDPAEPPSTPVPPIGEPEPADPEGHVEQDAPS